ncbi:MULTISPECIES: threonine synthase [Limnochorda]|uniref:threonine synthase n=1 Tax=Limnochorda TaxID=1676651 RepID=UPI0017D848D0|nr:threonine synthase [Limnochorda pilosa]MBO2485981.1 threonine synthase [Bacillota bacterium]MBO2518853.1 threonine synthase [Bacillota bacterium]NMA72010.1 threonine synthase [Bacillota bacterium]
MPERSPGLIERYRPYLPVTPSTPVVTLAEGWTPLLPAPRLARALELPVELYLKVEGANPTGSFKDRGMTVAVSLALEAGARAVVCASTGNTSASAAAYAARAGLQAVVLIPRGAVARGKLAQAVHLGARVLEVEGNFDAALRLVRALAESERLPIRLVNSVNPHRLQGQKTAAFEVCDQLGGPPDMLALPVGNAGNITAYWMGFQEYASHGLIERLPKLLGFQAEGAAPLVRGVPVAAPETVATAIRIGHPASWEGAIKARDQSGGVIEAVSDGEILQAYRAIAAQEGVFCEPASAISVAGVAKLARQGYFRGGETVVCVLTGHGLKDPDQAVAGVPEPQVVPDELSAVMEALEGMLA